MIDLLTMAYVRSLRARVVDLEREREINVGALAKLAMDVTQLGFCVASIIATLRMAQDQLPGEPSEVPDTFVVLH